MICSERRFKAHSTINISQHALDVIVSPNPKVQELLITANHIERYLPNFKSTPLHMQFLRQPKITKKNCSTSTLQRF